MQSRFADTWVGCTNDQTSSQMYELSPTWSATTLSHLKATFIWCVFYLKLATEKHELKIVITEQCRTTVSCLTRSKWISLVAFNHYGHKYVSCSTNRLKQLHFALHWLRTGYIATSMTAPIACSRQWQPHQSNFRSWKDCLTKQKNICNYCT